VQAVGARGEKFEEFEVAEDLELLADFVGDVTSGLQVAKTRPSSERIGHALNLADRKYRQSME